ncbi:MAG: NgoFVII family restriction endonuclease [Anaerolineae bacterium]|nr:NgoFVII family restriction endonuclease [Anaerolineae bacterium]
MPTIFDNITFTLSDGLRRVLTEAHASAFCVGYLNLRGWGQVADLVERFKGGSDDACCRVLVGMYRPPEEEMRLLQGLHRDEPAADGPTRARLKASIINGFKHQLEFGLPTAEAQTTLRELARQIRAGRVRVKAFLRYPLHAKLYLVERRDPATPTIAFVGSSNLTYRGLSAQGELNVDVVEQDAALKLKQWFEDRWADPLAVDLSDELAALIEGSWASLEAVRPYLVYLKMAWHLSEEARESERQLKLPKVLRGVLLDFQVAAVALAAQYLHRRGGVLLGDVVGLGKTLMATAVARILQEDDGSNSLIICPPRLRPMWEQYVEQYGLVARVLSLGEVVQKLPELPRYRLVIIDESHNLRNREGKRYRAIADYIARNDARVILITATPYNKQYTDLSNQLRLFVDEDRDLRIRPERLLQEWRARGRTEADFRATFNVPISSLRAFEKSESPEDWRDLMRLFLVRRTRSFIIRQYARFDDARQRYYVTLNGQPHYFPVREPRTLTFPVDEEDRADQYARLYHNDVVSMIAGLALPRYGLANYLVRGADRLADSDERRILANLARAGRRLIGFRRTNLFKRLESSGHSFLLSVRRHLLRDLITLYALENGLPVPIGTQDPAMLDTAISDSEEEITNAEEEEAARNAEDAPQASDLEALRQQAAAAYQHYRSRYATRFDWLAARFFDLRTLRRALMADIEVLRELLERSGDWQPQRDAKLAELVRVVAETHRRDKVLIFTQFADTALYLLEQLQRRGLTDLAVATNATNDAVALARRFSPSSNGGLRAGETELRVLIATDVLAEGQNLQDAHIVVNYDLPWAIIRLIQRAGRVDRIGQAHDTVLVYSFLPADGVEKLIRLRRRLFQRLQENQEVLGTDESFFGEDAANKLRDLYTEKAGVLDDDEDTGDIDLASLALQVWNSASAEDRRAALRLPPVVAASAPLQQAPGAEESNPPGAITYLRYPDGMDALVRVDEQGQLVSQSLSAVFAAAACAPDTPALPLALRHYELVGRCAEIALREQTALGGQLGSLRSTARRVYERLRQYRDGLRSEVRQPAPERLERLNAALESIYHYPLKERAREALGRQLSLGITDAELADMVIRMLEEEQLCQVTEAPPEPQEPQIICSLGLQVTPEEG